MKKYLFHFGYLGTNFSGLQKQSVSGINENTICKYLELGLQFLFPLDKPKAYVSSRTDAGVHAISSTFQTLLNLPPISQNKEGHITIELNKFFKDSSLDIRIHRTQVVPLEFNCRAFATSRTYLYRIALVRTNEKILHTRLPIPELNKCLLLQRSIFDLEKAKSVCELFKGTHNFKNFVKEDKRQPRSTIRTILELKIEPGKPIFEPSYDSSYNDLQFLDVTISSGGFLWNQVRRIVGAIISVASERIPLEKIEYYLNYPDEKGLSELEVVKPHGLFLQNIQYLPESFLEETYQDENIKDFLSKIYKMKTGLS